MAIFPLTATFDPIIATILGFDSSYVKEGISYKEYSIDAEGELSETPKKGDPIVMQDTVAYKQIQAVLTHITTNAEVVGQVVLTGAVGGMVAGASPAGPITGALTGAAPVTGTIVTPSTTKVL